MSVTKPRRFMSFFRAEDHAGPWGIRGLQASTVQRVKMGLSCPRWVIHDRGGRSYTTIMRTLVSICPFRANRVIYTVRHVRVRVPCNGGGKRLHFHGVPEEVNASIPATAHSTSCSSVAPATPSAPSTWPARMMGRPPGRLMSGAPSPTTVAARKYSEPSIDASPLGRPDLAETNAFPIDAR
jgi:hypothetical protein